MQNKSQNEKWNRHITKLVWEKKENKDEKQDNTRIGADTLMLISQEIPSIAAYAKDPNLKNPAIATKHSKKKVLETKKAEERAAALIRILETNEKKLLSLILELVLDRETSSIAFSNSSFPFGSPAKAWSKTDCQLSMLLDSAFVSSSGFESPDSADNII